MVMEAARRRPAGEGADADALPPMTTGRQSTRFAGSGVVPAGPQSSPAPTTAADCVSVHVVVPHTSCSQ